MTSRRNSSGHAWLRAVPAQPLPPSEPELSDDELIAGVVRGDDRVAARLYDRLVAVVDRTLYRVFGRREADHDDLVQSTFEQIVITLQRRKFAGACSLSTWASTVASHVGLNALRARRRERRVIDRDHSESEAPEPRRYTRGDPEHDITVRSQIERVRAHLLEMDPAKAQTLFLHDVLGHELAEIAVLTGVSVAAAQSRLVRGRKELMERVGRDPSADPRVDRGGANGS